MKTYRKAILVTAASVLVATLAAKAAGYFPNFPIVGSGSYSAGAGVTVPAGPSSLTGNELVPADTGLPGGQAPQTVTVPTGMLVGGWNGVANALIGADFGMNLWQRGTTPVSAANIAGQGYMTADGWYATTINSGAAQTVTVTKQTGTADVLTNNLAGVASLASLRVQRPASQTGTQVQCIGQLLPNTESQRFIGNNAVFSVYLLAGANLSSAANAVTLTIAYHTAADATSEAANAQGTNTNTFATSAGGTQNLTGYVEAVNTVVNPTTTWARYSTSVVVPTVNAAGTVVTGVGVKICSTPVGTAGTSDFLEVANPQFEARLGTASSGPTAFSRRTVAEETLLETSRYWTVMENGSAGTPIYAVGQAGATNTFNVAFRFPTLMRITPVISPITAGGFKVNAAGTLQTVSLLSVTGLTQTPANGALGGAATITAGQGTTFVGTGTGVGVLGFSAEP